jgi:glucokinase
MAKAYPQSSLTTLMRDDPDALNATAVFQAAADGDELGLLVLDEVSEYLGAGVLNLFSLLSPEVIILGGGVFSNADILVERLRTIVEPAVEQRKHHHGLPHGIALSKLGPVNVGMIGAASLVHYFTQIEII